MPDFQEIYGLDLADLWTGALTVRRALILTWGLQNHPRSRFRAERLGGEQFLGWSDETYLAADTRDGVVGLLMSLGGKPKDFVPVDRPTAETSQPEDGGTIANFDPIGFMRKLQT